LKHPKKGFDKKQRNIPYMRFQNSADEATLQYVLALYFLYIENVCSANKNKRIYKHAHLKFDFQQTRAIINLFKMLCKCTLFIIHQWNLNSVQMNLHAGLNRNCTMYKYNE